LRTEDKRAKAWETGGTYPNSLDKIAAICLSAQIYATLDNVDSMLPYARRCFTAPNGYSKALLNEPEFARHLNDPRVRALAQVKTN
jgi:hypothetical protein